MTRRDFLLGSLRMSAAAVVGGPLLSSLGAAPVQLVGVKTSYALAPLGPWSPAGFAGVSDAPASRWLYEWMFWDAPSPDAKKGGGEVKIVPIGTLEITRGEFPDRIVYSAVQQRMFADYSGTFICAKEASEPLLSWKTERSINQPATKELLVSRMEGTVKGRMATVKGTGGVEEIPLSSTLHSELSLLVQPAVSEALVGQKIAFLQDGEIVRQGISLRRDPAADIAWQGLNTEAWLLAGGGIMPLHVLRDPQGRGLCRSAFTTSLVLKETTHA